MAKPEKQPIPESEKQRAEALHNELVRRPPRTTRRSWSTTSIKGELRRGRDAPGLEARHDEAHPSPVFA